MDYFLLTNLLNQRIDCLQNREILTRWFIFLFNQLIIIFQLPFTAYSPSIIPHNLTNLREIFIYKELNLRIALDSLLNEEFTVRGHDAKDLLRCLKRLLLLFSEVKNAKRFIANWVTHADYQRLLCFRLGYLHLDYPIVST